MIYCCNGCVPPKRNPWCHIEGNCPEYTAEKAEHDAQKAVADQKRDVQNGLNGQTMNGVYRAYKARTHAKGRKYG